MKQKRHFNWKNFGWLVSTILFYTTLYGTMFYYMGSYLFVNKQIPVFVHPIIMIVSYVIIRWYLVRNRKYGYGLEYYNKFFKDRTQRRLERTLREYREARRAMNARESIIHTDNREKRKVK